jgi:hypothetical protein
MRKQFPEIAPTAVKAAETESKALELFCTQLSIIAFSLSACIKACASLAFFWCGK